MKYSVTHRTRYSYGGPVRLCHNEAYLTPRDSDRQRCLSSSISVDPVPDTYSTRVDYFGNNCSYYSIQSSFDCLTVTAQSTVEIDESDPEPPSETSWEAARDLLAHNRVPAAIDAAEFSFDSPLVSVNAALAEYAATSFGPSRPLLDAVRELNSRIHRDFEYDPDFTTVATPLTDVMVHRKGVCQDFAHVAIGCVRSLGLAARYVSGYLETAPPPGRERLVGADASHAWFSVYVPATGWFDFDPTNDLAPSTKHITTAWGRDYSDVTPIKGIVFTGAKESELEVAVDVVRLDG